MGDDEIHSTEDIIKVAGEVVQAILKESEIVTITRYDYGGFHNKGPLSWFCFYSKKFNPKGKFAIDIEALTTKQKEIVIDVVGEAIPKWGSKAADSKLNISASLFQQNEKWKPDIGFSRLEMQEMKERSMIDTIVQAINSK